MRAKSNWWLWNECVVIVHVCFVVVVGFLRTHILSWRRKFDIFKIYTAQTDTRCVTAHRSDEDNTNNCKITKYSWDSKNNNNSNVCEIGILYRISFAVSFRYSTATQFQQIEPTLRHSLWFQLNCLSTLDILTHSWAAFFYLSICAQNCKRRRRSLRWIDICAYSESHMWNHSLTPVSILSSDDR